ncbi:dihydroneopterin aldolase [Roseomonas sp. KE2513]|uniref:dihydroneopterin aldolase n=1 Tax=Roseomonas sp. KE2513 TaxID=2479202 RepID=UPI002816377A|nr:dihydroneopterin aldolase [Roseomonas sp. KE2513]
MNLVRTEAGGGHTLLAETLAERSAAAVLDSHPRIRAARVTVQKPDAFHDVAAVGVTVERGMV